MKTLRNIHLYLGCIFAPIILFMAVSGIWQMLDVHSPGWLVWLSTIHTGGSVKTATGSATLSSPMMHWFVVIAALCLVATIVLGIVMAFRFGRRKTALGCLLAGVAVPLILILLARG